MDSRLSVARGAAARGAAALAAACAIASAAPAQADAAWSFARCDGFGRPSTAGDGMIENAATWKALFDSSTGDADVDDVAFGRAGIASCDTALGSDFLLPDYWLRRVNLLRAKAMHQIAAGEPAAALATLDQAAAAARGNDVFYRRTEGIGIDLVRALALVQLGRRAEAEPLAMAAWRQRPFHRGVTMAAYVTLAGGPAEADRAALLLRLGQLDPRFRKRDIDFTANRYFRPKDGIDNLHEALPKAETRESTLTYNLRLKRWADYRKPWFPPPAGSSEKAIWVNGHSSLAMVEELALLQAAEFARSKRRPLFIILERSDIQNYQVSNYYQDPQSGVPMNIVTSLGITSLPETSPDPYWTDRMKWTIRVDEVYAALAPVYGEAAAREWPR